MKVLTNPSYKEHFELYTETHSPVTVSNCKMGLAKKGMILLSNMALIHYRIGLRIGKQDVHKQFTLLEGTYSIDDFNGKSKVAFLQQRQD